MEEKKTYIKPEILVEEWKVYKVTKCSNQYRKTGVYEVSNFGRVKHKKISEETKIKLRGKTPWNKGISPSEETRRKQSEARKGKTPWNKGKPSPSKGKHRVYNDPNDHTAGYHYE